MNREETLEVLDNIKSVVNDLPPDVDIISLNHFQKSELLVSILSFREIFAGHEVTIDHHGRYVKYITDSVKVKTVTIKEDRTIPRRVTLPGTFNGVLK